MVHCFSCICPSLNGQDVATQRAGHAELGSVIQGRSNNTAAAGKHGCGTAVYVCMYVSEEARP